MSFFEWFNGEFEKAKVDPTAQKLEELGFTFQHTGGGCLAWVWRNKALNLSLCVGDGDSKVDFASNWGDVCFDVCDYDGGHLDAVTRLESEEQLFASIEPYMQPE